MWPAIFGKKPDGRASAYLASPLPTWQTTTDEQGRFTLKGLPSLMPMNLLAGSVEYASQWIEIKDAGPVGATLSPGGRIPGVVLQPDGKPAPRVCVRCEAMSPLLPQQFGHGSAVTDESGHFQLSALCAGVYKVWAESTDLTVIACLGLKVFPSAATEEQRVQLVRGGFIVGRIVDKETGKPIVPGDHTDVGMYGPARGDGGTCEATPVLPDGTFRIRAPAGMNLIYLRSFDGADGSAAPREQVTVREGEETKVEWQVRPRTKK